MLDTDEAIDEMENLDHDFHLFLHKSNGSPCVLYRRIDGDYGILIGKTE